MNAAVQLDKQSSADSPWPASKVRQVRRRTRTGLSLHSRVAEQRLNSCLKFPGDPLVPFCVPCMARHGQDAAAPRLGIARYDQFRCVVVEEVPVLGSSRLEALSREIVRMTILPPRQW